MRRIILFCLLCMTAFPAFAEYVHISTEKTSLVLRANRNEAPLFIFYGSRLNDADLKQFDVSGAGIFRHAYPEYNRHTADDFAILVEHADGNIMLRLLVTAVTRSGDDKGEIVTISTKDPVYPFYVDLKYRTYNGTEIIEMWTEIRHSEKKGDVILKKYASAHLPVWGHDVWVSHQYGDWAKECTISEEKLVPGQFVVKNHDGARNTHTAHSEIMLSLDGKFSEDHGRVIGAALSWPGNYKLSIDTDKIGKFVHHFFAGIDETASEYHLKAGETFVTPPLALSFSTEGKGGISRAFHKWGREYKIHKGYEPRKVLLNSWEGVYMDVDHEKMASMMKDLSYLGGELFVMDDGWFANKWGRTEGSGLGDWDVDLKKLPDGIPALIDEAGKNNVLFGIWIEPESGNWKNSELWEKHPDWFLQNPGYEPLGIRGGSQALLDMTNPKVQDFVFGIVDGLLTEYPGIAYIKWDANVYMANYGSKYLPAKRQSHLGVEYHRGLLATLERVRAKYPDVIIQDCASGGGRVNYGLMPYFDEVWTSDNTDAWQRVFIQWGTSEFFPASIMGAHVSASPNHQSGRVVPLKYRFDVAMSGRLGLEMKPSDFSPEEMEFAKRAIADYKRLRDVIQFGELYRLVSPYEANGELASLMYVNEDKSHAVFYAYKMKHYVNQHITPVCLAGLDPDKMYRLHEINKNDDAFGWMEGTVVSGRALMSAGFQPYLHKEYASRMIELIEVK